MITIRKDDVTDASPLARAWIDGFLAGNEPDFARWLGVSWAEAHELYDSDEMKFWEWKADLRWFRHHGYGGLRETDPEPDEDDQPEDA